MTSSAFLGTSRCDEFVVVLVQAEDLHGAFQVLQRHHRVGFAALFGNALLHLHHQAADARHVAVGQCGQLAGVVEGVFFQDRRERRQRMAGDVEAEQFLFVRQQFVLRPFGQLLFRLRRRPRRAPPTCQTACPGPRCRSWMMPAARVKHAVDLGKQRRARFAKAIARAGLDQGLQHFAVDSAAVHPLAQFGQRA